LKYEFIAAPNADFNRTPLNHSQMNKTDINKDDDIRMLVNTIYGIIQDDEHLSNIFTDTVVCCFKGGRAEFTTTTAASIASASSVRRRWGEITG
jgi:hypothetical protein